jgi:hypothetical protein
MQQDPMEEWRRLTTLYSEMGDLEISELVDQINDLTPNAQQILRDELKKRGILAQTNAPRVPVPLRENSAAVHWHKEQDTAADPDVDPSEEDGSFDYTWKVALCRCESLDEAAARSEMLRRAGIDSWIQRPGARFVVPWLELGVGDIQIDVAADQLEAARAVIAQPIPQDVIDLIKEANSTATYEIPRCPKCKAEDPTLESVEPSNNWLCESCGYTWSDPVPDPTAPQTST